MAETIITFKTKKLKKAHGQQKVKERRMRETFTAEEIALCNFLVDDLLKQPKKTFVMPCGYKITPRSVQLFIEKIVFTDKSVIIIPMPHGEATYLSG